MEATAAKMTADPKCWELVNKGTDNFTPGSIRDSMWRTV